MTRSYQLKRRAERMAETRRRIVEAAVELHTSVGPARTTISDIAELAGVQRHTVYAHFADQQALFGACSAHWASLHPFPDPARWVEIEDPQRRLRTALREIYDWYETVEHDVAIFERDAKVHDLTAALVARRKARTWALREGILRGRPRRKVVLAALGHALEFETWHSLVRVQGLNQKQAVDAMLSFVSTV
jgi:AcrR family transcriptional regulator